MRNQVQQSKSGIYLKHLLPKCFKGDDATWNTHIRNVLKKLETRLITVCSCVVKLSAWQRRFFSSACRALYRQERKLWRENVR